MLKTKAGTEFELKDKFSKRDSLEVQKQMMAIAPKGFDENNLDTIKDNPEFLDAVVKIQLLAGLKSLNGKTTRDEMYEQWLDLDNSDADEISKAVDEFTGLNTDSKKK